MDSTADQNPNQDNAEISMVPEVAQKPSDPLRTRAALEATLFFTKCHQQMIHIGFYYRTIIEHNGKKKKISNSDLQELAEKYFDGNIDATKKQLINNENNLEETIYNHLFIKNINDDLSNKLLDLMKDGEGEEPSLFSSEIARKTLTEISNHCKGDEELRATLLTTLKSIHDKLEEPKFNHFIHVMNVINGYNSKNPQPWKNSLDQLEKQLRGEQLGIKEIQHASYALGVEEQPAISPPSDHREEEDKVKMMAIISRRFNYRKGQEERISHLYNMLHNEELKKYNEEEKLQILYIFAHKIKGPLHNFTNASKAIEEFEKMKSQGKKLLTIQPKGRFMYEFIDIQNDTTIE